VQELPVLWQFLHALSLLWATPRYAELRADPQEWTSYHAEAQLTDAAAGDGLPDAREEYPEYSQ
jgi:hypothetical protein